MTRNQEIAKKILEQLGDNKFVAMTGAKHRFAIENGISFKLPSNFAKDGINCVEIVLSPADVYTVKFKKIGRRRMKKDFTFNEPKVETISEHTDVYHDMLRDIFTKYTGLDTSL